jgi:hypothetical protein
VHLLCLALGGGVYREGGSERTGSVVAVPLGALREAGYGPTRTHGTEYAAAAFGLGPEAPRMLLMVVGWTHYRLFAEATAKPR